MKCKRALIFLSAVLLLATASNNALATGKCDGADIANGPFVYTSLSLNQATFNGPGGAQVSTNFSVTAPSVDTKQQTALPDLFPGEGQQTCTATAFATISALEIQKVGDAEGNPILPIAIDSSSILGQLIAGAFSFTPSSQTFAIGETANIAVDISNPNVSPEDYGDYDIKLAAKAPGYGIGVGDGPHILLSLRASTATDTTPPTVNITKPSGDEILGVIPIEIKAVDPDTPPVATGLNSIIATVSSAGGAVSNLSIPLTLDLPLPVAAGIMVTGTGCFTPIGGTGPAGTTNDLAFTSSSRSGIGSYTINAQATDGAGNTGYGSNTFAVKYDVTFSQQSAPPACTTKTGTPGSNCTAMFQFSANRSNITSDGAFMYDHTVVVKLVRDDGMVMAAHSYGTGSILSQVQIDPDYKTHFKRGDLAGSPTAAGTYKAYVYFLNVDGSEILQATSNNVIF
ncbi:MAG: hypothetical protein EG828_04225 [Deltaproteobacteria bacterium]|nr:hypothetical protein [Deltaproteobacteria bacterium]